LYRLLSHNFFDFKNGSRESHILITHNFFSGLISSIIAYRRNLHIHAKPETLNHLRLEMNYVLIFPGGVNFDEFKLPWPIIESRTMEKKLYPDQESMSKVFKEWFNYLGVFFSIIAAKKPIKYSEKFKYLITNYHSIKNLTLPGDNFNVNEFLLSLFKVHHHNQCTFTKNYCEGFLNDVFSKSELAYDSFYQSLSIVKSEQMECSKHDVKIPYLYFLRALSSNVIIISIDKDGKEKTSTREYSESVKSVGLVNKIGWRTWEPSRFCHNFCDCAYSKFAKKFGMEEVSDSSCDEETTSILSEEIKAIPTDDDDDDDKVVTSKRSSSPEPDLPNKK
jgi:hypothetical protein